MNTLKTYTLISLLGSLLLLISCQAQQKTSTQSEKKIEPDTSHYSYTSENNDGIGKWYMGREISHIMGHLGASWLERTEREQEERTDLLIQSLEVKPTDVILDVGAGTGYFSFRLAPLVPEGKVIAEDIQQEMLDLIEAKNIELKVANIETRLGTITDPKVEDSSIDLVLIVDVYHEISHPYEMMKAIVKGMKSGGRLALVEYKAEDPMVPIKRLHKMSLAQSQKEMAAAGLTFVENKEVLPRQHLMIFKKR